MFWVSKSFADPESFVRGGSLWVFFLVYDGGEDQNITKTGHCWPASETPFAGVLMMAQNLMLAW